MGRVESKHCVALLVVPVVETGANDVVTVDGTGANDVVTVDVAATVVVGSDRIDVVVDAEGATVVQPDPEHLTTLMSAQFQNFSAPLLLVLGSTTSAGHEAKSGFHHALASPPNLEAIHDCVELLL